MNYNKNLEPSEVQALAGHSNINTTYKYVHKSNEKLKKAYTVFDDVYNEKIEIQDNNTIFAPIMCVASVINECDYVDMNKVMELLKCIDSKAEISYSNFSDKINETKKYLLNNYPSLENIQSLAKQYCREDFEKKVRTVYGNKIIIKTIPKEVEYEMH